MRCAPRSHDPDTDCASHQRVTFSSRCFHRNHLPFDHLFSISYHLFHQWWSLLLVGVHPFLSHTHAFYMASRQTALVAFLCVLGLSKLTTKPLAGTANAKKATKKATAAATVKDALKTPPRRTRPKEADSLGTMETPSGRRSARIASRRKEDWISSPILLYYYSSKSKKGWREWKTERE
jgi:hypothetical protein